MKTWKQIITEEMDKHGERWGDIVEMTIKEWEAEVGFDAEYYTILNGVPFTVWTKKRVYFPTSYDGIESCASVSRNPDGIATKHVGDEWADID
jgi:hypothetical protein